MEGALDSEMLRDLFLVNDTRALIVRPAARTWPEAVSMARAHFNPIRHTNHSKETPENFCPRQTRPGRKHQGVSEV